LQDDATPENLAQALGNWLDHKEARDALRERFAAMHQELARGHDERIVQALQPYLTAPPGGPSHASPQRNDLAALRS